MPREVLRRLWLSYRATGFRSTPASDLAADVARRLSAVGVSCVLLKGAALVRTLYEDPGLRPVGDLDILVDERDLPRAVSLLESMNFWRFGRPLRTEWPTCEFHLVYVSKRSIPVELHWRLFEDYQPYLFDLPAVWARAVPVADLAAGAFTMSPEHELAYLCLHLERHALVFRSLIDRPDWLRLLVMPRSEARLIWLHDVALLLLRRGDALDWDRLVGDARRWAIDSRVRAVLEVCERAFNVGAPADVMRALGRRRPGVVEGCAHRAIMALNRVSDGVARRRVPSERLLHGLEVLVNRATGWSHMWNSVVPPAAYLAARYPDSAMTIQRRARHAAMMTRPVLDAVGRRLGGRRVTTMLGARPVPGSGQAIVVVPVYKTQPDAREAVSWDRCLAVFPTTPVALAAPEGLDVSAYVRPERQETRPIHVARFDPGFFSSNNTYSRLLLSAGFYQAFATYEFILIYQLDAFVFRDELAEWCARGWDYVGAPWIDPEWLTPGSAPEMQENRVGNGGFSLRRVGSALKLLTEKPEVAARWGENEDVFWSFIAPAHVPLKIPTLAEAVAFSFEVRPERAFALNGSKLPFGCHGWWDPRRVEFWRPFLERCGYAV